MKRKRSGGNAVNFEHLLSAKLKKSCAKLAQTEITVPLPLDTEFTVAGETILRDNWATIKVCGPFMLVGIKEGTGELFSRNADVLTNNTVTFFSNYVKKNVHNWIGNPAYLLYNLSTLRTFYNRLLVHGFLTSFELVKNKGSQTPCSSTATAEIFCKHWKIHRDYTFADNVSLNGVLEFVGVIKSTLEQFPNQFDGDKFASLSVSFKRHCVHNSLKSIWENKLRISVNIFPSLTPDGEPVNGITEHCLHSQAINDLYPVFEQLKPLLASQ